MLCQLESGKLFELHPLQDGMYWIGVRADQAAKTLFYELSSKIGRYQFRDLTTENGVKIGVEAKVGAVTRVYALDEMFFGWSPDIKIGHYLTINGKVSESPIVAIFEQKIPEHLQPGQRFVLNGYVHRVLVTWGFNKGTKVMDADYKVFTIPDGDYVTAERDYCNLYDRPTLIEAFRLKEGMLLQVGDVVARIINVAGTGNGYMVLSLDGPYAGFKMSNDQLCPVRCYFGCSSAPNREGWVYTNSPSLGWGFMKLPSLKPIVPGPSIQVELDEINSRLSRLFKAAPQFMILESKPTLLVGSNTKITLEAKQ